MIALLVGAAIIVFGIAFVVFRKPISRVRAANTRRFGGAAQREATAGLDPNRYAGMMVAAGCCVIVVGVVLVILGFVA